MTWEVEVSDGFIEWYAGLAKVEQMNVAAGVGMLERYGPELGRPYIDTLKGSSFPN